MKNKFTLWFLAFLFVSTSNMYASDSEKYKKAERFVEMGNFYEALDIYQEFLKNSANNANLNFKIGYCYLNTALEKSKAIPYLEFAVKHTSKSYKGSDVRETKAPIESFFYLGKAYRVNYRFNDAIRVFTELKEIIPAREKKFIAEINHEINYCKTAKKLVRKPVEMTVSNLGKQINTEYTEHSPVISGDESVLIFTSKRKGSTGNRQTGDGQYYEDIFISYSRNGRFQQAKPISENINSFGHEASIGLSFDGRKLLIYKDDNQDGNIYISNKTNVGWSVPKPMPETINSKYKETHACMSFDETEIYFTSDRKGGYGGLDIYRVKKLPNGKWSKAQNLGPNVNTAFDEEGPYLHPDGTSLYFASEGHNSMGGFDIFVSYKENGKWQKAKNIGYPINTPDDDIYYVPSVDGRRAYYSSFANNSLGEYDIFRIDLSESHVRNQTVISGIAKSKDGVLLQDGIITISKMNDDLVGIYTPDEFTKKFLAILPRGKTYRVLYESSNVETFERIIKVPEFAYDQSGKVVILDSIDVKNASEGYKTPVVVDHGDAKNKTNEGGYGKLSFNDLFSSLYVNKEENNDEKNGDEMSENEEGIDIDEEGSNEVDEENDNSENDNLASDKIDKETKQWFGKGFFSKKSNIVYSILGLLSIFFILFFIKRRRDKKNQ